MRCFLNDSKTETETETFPVSILHCVSLYINTLTKDTAFFAWGLEIALREWKGWVGSGRVGSGQVRVGPKNGMPHRKVYLLYGINCLNTIQI